MATLGLYFSEHGSDGYLGTCGGATVGFARAWAIKGSQTHPNKSRVAFKLLISVPPYYYSTPSLI
jgi:hypothetical protein